MAKTLEGILSTKLKIWCGENNYQVIRQNVGTFYTKYGEMIKIGEDGEPDLLILRNDGIACFVETKVHPRKPTAEQCNFIYNLRERKFRAGCAYTIEEAIEIIEGKGNGHELPYTHDVAIELVKEHLRGKK